MKTMYPWLQEQWQKFASMLHAQSLPHALMLVGPQGIGKHEFATAISAALICEQTTECGLACGECKPCQLFSANTFPDYINVAADEEGKAISVDNIRELITKLHLTSHFESHKIALIENADLMNANASNALLKTLEEPSEKTLIILVTSYPLSLPATIRSRCQMIKFYAPKQDQALTWLNSQSQDIDWEPLLRVALGAPLQAMQYHESELLDQRILVIQGFLQMFEPKANPMKIATQIEAIPFALCFQWIQAIIVDLLRIKASDNPITLENPDFYRSLLALAPRVQVTLLVELWELVLERKKLCDNSLNRRLFAESLIIRSYKLALKNGL